VPRLALNVYVGAIALLAVLFVLELPGADVGALDLLIALSLVFGPWLLGALLGWRWGRTWPRIAAMVALGVVVTPASTAAFLFLLGSSPDAACGEDECLHYLGHWIEASLAVRWPIYAAAAWSLSALLFSERVRRWRRTSALT
jgi:hypothetical protein